MKSKTKPESKSTEPIVIATLDQLQALVDAPVYCDFALDGQLIRVPCKRASQDVEEQIRSIEREAQPKFDPKRGPNGDYDYSAPDYLAKRDKNAKVARALRVYTCCPAVAAQKPGLTDREQIYQYVKSILSENILELIALTTQGGGVGLVEKVNFTSPAGLEN